MSPQLKNKEKCDAFGGNAGSQKELAALAFLSGLFIFCAISGKEHPTYDSTTHWPNRRAILSAQNHATGK
jgi:hypothetical protein